MPGSPGIVGEGQVEYRLTGHAGCYVQHDGEGLAGQDQPAVGGQVSLLPGRW